MVSAKMLVGVCAGVSASLFIGYCVYFDRQRHNDPEFKKKLRERRRAAAKSCAVPFEWPPPNFPDMRDAEAVRNYFLQEIQFGEQLLAAGDLEKGVAHLGNAVAVCGQPNDLLNVLQQTLQPKVVHMLVQRLMMFGPKLARAQQMNRGGVEVE